MWYLSCQCRYNSVSDDETHTVTDKTAYSSLLVCVELFWLIHPIGRTVAFIRTAIFTAHESLAEGTWAMFL